MKHFRYAFLLLFVFLAACYEINEEIVINENGSGTYATRTDMSAFLEMAKTMASEEDLARQGMGEKIDTTILMRDMLDSASGVTPDQRRVFGGGKMKVKMSLAENVLKADVDFPFNNYSDLALLMAGSGGGGLAEVFKKMMSKEEGDHSDSDPNFDQINNVFDVTATKNILSKKLNRAKFDSLMARPEISQARMMMNTGMEILFTTTIRLPRPVKKADNPMVKLSDDKKTVTIRYDLLKILDTPEKFSYTIEY